MQAAGRRVVAGPAETRVEAEPRRLRGNRRLGHPHERGVDAEGVALDPGLGGEVRHRLEGGDELRPAVGIARIIERVDADEQVARAGRLRPAEAEREEDGVAGGDIGDRDLILGHALLRHGDVVGERRAAEAREIERQHDMALGAHRRRDSRRRLQLDAVALVVVDGEREQPVARLAREAGNDHRIHASRDEYDRQLAHGGRI